MDENNKKKLEIVNGIDVIVKIIYCVLGFIHFFTFLRTESLLDGHAYGSPDKYGSYNYGLYTDEILQIEKNKTSLWLLVLGLVILGIAIIVLYFMKVKYGYNNNNTSFSKVTIFLAILLIICFVGTVWVSIHYGMYD